VLDPAGPRAAAIDRLGWIMIIAGAAIFALVLLLTAWAILAPRPARKWLGSRAVVIWGGVAFPVVALSALLVYGLALAGALSMPPGDAPLRIAVIGERWWWRIHYLGPDGAPALVSANEIRIPTGRPIEIILTSPDVIHSFWVPNLDGKRDMIPGRENILVTQADRPGVYRGQCAEYCGLQHALMAFDVVAYEPPEFDRWLAAQRAPAATPTDPLLRHGLEVFLANGCGACHTIRGTPAAGTIGPDLTHVGGRLTLAAGTLANNRGTLAAWTVHNQEIKTGNFMPSYEMLPPPDLQALAAYLESLK